MATDPAVAIFLDDARRLGLSPRQYEDKFHINLMSAERSIRAHETTVGDLPVEAFGISYDDPDLEFDPIDAIARQLHNNEDCRDDWYDCQDGHSSDYRARAGELLAALTARAA